MLLHRLTQDKRKVYTSGQPDLCAITINILSRCCPSKLRLGMGESSMEDFIWAGIWAMFLKNAIEIAQVMGIALAWLIFALMCLAQLGKLYDWIKRECDLERLLDTPQKRKDLKMEGKTTYCYPEPEDEGPLTKVCPTCFERSPENRQHCMYKSCNWDTLVHRPITEPLPTLTTTDETATK